MAEISARPVRLLGFNGELCDPVTGHYLLGNGYRAFNPALMRFNSPDSLSPFGKGGINAYAYCLGDPLNHVDRDGHIPGLLSVRNMFRVGYGAALVASTGTFIATLVVKDNNLRAGLATATGLLLMVGAVGTLAYWSKPVRLADRPPSSSLPLPSYDMAILSPPSYNTALLSPPSYGAATRPQPPLASSVRDIRHGSGVEETSL